MFRILAVGLAATLAAHSSHADAIRIGETRHENVLVDRTETTIFVRIPDTGALLTVPAAHVDNADIDMSPTYSERLALRKRWNAARTPEPAAGLSPSPTFAPDAPAPEPERRAAPSGEPQTVLVDRAAPPEGFVTDGMVPAIHLKDVPLDQALRAMLRSLHLDYRVEGGIVYVSTPERLRAEPGGEMEARVYTLNGMSDTLPKIVVRNTGGPGTIAAPPGAGLSNAAGAAP